MATTDRKAPLWIVLVIAGIATLPMLIAAILAILDFPRFPGSGLLVWLLADVDAAAQFSRIISYAGLCTAALLGASYATEIKALLSFDKPKRLIAFGAIVLVYLLAHLLLVYKLQSEGTRINLLNQFPRGMVGRENEGIAQILQYAQWVTASALTLAAVALGLPRPGDPPAPAPAPTNVAKPEEDAGEAEPST